MIATLAPSVNPNTEPRTVEFITPTALRCHCAEYRTNHFCLHLVYYTAAKIQTHLESCQRKGVMQAA